MHVSFGGHSSHIVPNQENRACLIVQQSFDCIDKNQKVKQHFELSHTHFLTHQCIRHAYFLEYFIQMVIVFELYQVTPQ